MVDTLLEIESRTGDGGHSLLVLRGDCVLGEGERLWTTVREELKGAKALDLELSQLSRLDGAGAALLQALRVDAGHRGVPLEFVGGSAEVRRMLDVYDCGRGAQCAPALPRQIGTFDQIGQATAGALVSIRDVFDFVGDLTNSVRRALNDVRSVNWRSIPGLMERAGADGVPIILLINFLVGLIVGLQAAFQLERFGAGLFIADLVGLSMVREMAPLMTAIVVAGRSGASFAAELGTMKVNQEVDALQTLGFDPQRFLVLPRLVALVSMVPLLTLLSMLVGIFGGLLVAVQRLNLTTLAYFVELEKAISFSDVAGGLIKSGVFAITITLISCQRGLATSGGAAGVGRSTTSAVVVTLFFLVVLDALFTLFFNVFGF